MRGGKLKHVVTIQQPITAQGDSGAVKATGWSTFATTRASINQVAGSEGVTFKEHQAIATHEIKIRWMANITTKMRVVYDSRNFYIKSAPDKDERRKEITLHCLEGV